MKRLDHHKPAKKQPNTMQQVKPMLDLVLVSPYSLDFQVLNINMIELLYTFRVSFYCFVYIM